LAVGAEIALLVMLASVAVEVGGVVEVDGEGVDAVLLGVDILVMLTLTPTFRKRCVEVALLEQGRERLLLEQV
jgi:hypothetical protein